MSIQAFYKDVLAALRYSVDDEDYISFLPPEGTPVPATVEKRRMVLPSTRRLKEGFTSELQPFHPLSESVARKGASPVLAHMQRCAKAILAFYYVGIATRLLAIAANPSKHKDLPPNCSDFLKKLADADKKSLTDFTALVKAAITKNKLVVLYLKNGGKLGGDKFNRLCVIHFPLIDLLNGDDDAVLGVKLRKKDRKTFIALLHHLLPFGDDPEYYSAGSNSRIAPFFDSFLRAYAKVAEQFNTVIRRHGEVLELADAYTESTTTPLNPIPLDYLPALDNLKEFYDKIPTLRGNEGSLSAQEEEEQAQQEQAKQAAHKPYTATAPEPAPRRPDIAPWDPTPVREQPQPVRSGGMSMEEFRNRLQPPAPPQPMYPQQQPAYPASYSAYGQPAYDPRRPAWLVGQQPPPPPSPFAQALMTPQSAPAAQGYGAYSGVSMHYAPPGRSSLL